MNHLKHRSNESIEDYLETILTLQKKLGQVRSIDIANEMNFSKPSVRKKKKNPIKMSTEFFSVLIFLFG